MYNAVKRNLVGALAIVNEDIVLISGIIIEEVAGIEI